MKKLLHTLLLAMLFSQGLRAQEWTYYKDFPVNVSPIDVVSNNAGTIFMWTSDSRFFYKTLNGSWTEMLTSGGGGPISARSISVDKASNRFYVGDEFSGGIYYTSNFGATWQQKYITTNPVTGHHEPIIGLANIENPNLFYGITASGFIPVIVKYTNNAQTVQIIEFDPNDFVENVAVEVFHTSNNKVLIGTHAGGIWIGENNGTTYSQTTFNQSQVTRFTEGDNGRVYALGNDSNTGEEFLIYSDDYMNWLPMDLPNTTDKYTTIYFDEVTRNLWLGSKTGLYRMLITPTSNSAWASGSFNNSEQYVIEVIGDQNGGLYNFSNQTIAQKLNPAGNAWANMNNGFTGTATKVIFGSNDKLFASSYSTNNISTATNATANWENVYLGEQTIGVNNLYVRPNGKVFANIYTKLKKSVDNGATYTDITPPNLNNFVLRFYVGEAGNLYVVKSNEIDKLYWSQDEGQTWSLLHTFPSYFDFFPDQIEAIAEDSSGVIYVVMNTLETSTGLHKVYYSTNSGASWNIKTYENPEQSNQGGTVFSKRDKTFVFYGELIFRFDYNSAPNDLIPINPPAGFTNMGNYMWVDDLGNYYTFGDDVFKSSDQGMTWMNLGMPDPVNAAGVRDILFDSNNKAYIVATDAAQPSQRGIYHVTETLGTEHPDTENPISVFPNPAQNTLNIQTSQTIEKITVYDVLGKKVIATGFTNSIDVSQLASGLYMVQAITTDNKTFTSKFIKN